MTRQKIATRKPLSSARVLQAAVALADEAGLEAFSMRGLAQELGVVPMALYKHVANKDELLDGMVDIVFSEIELPSGAGEPAQPQRGYGLPAEGGLPVRDGGPRLFGPGRLHLRVRLAGKGSSVRDPRQCRRSRAEEGGNDRRAWQLPVSRRDRYEAPRVRVRQRRRVRMGARSHPRRPRAASPHRSRAGMSGPDVATDRNREGSDCPRRTPMPRMAHPLAEPHQRAA